MDILVLSDSHGRRDKIEEAVCRQIKKPDALIFLGDGLRDLMGIEFTDIPVFTVAGNCDMGGFFNDGNTPIEQNLILGEKRIFFTHGHKYGVKGTLSPLFCEGAARDSDIILFGHTHVAFEKTLMPDNEYGIKTAHPIYVMNPGSIGTYPYYFGNISIDRGGRVLLSHGMLSK